MELTVINKFQNAFSLMYDFYHNIGTDKTEENLKNSINKFIAYGDVIAVIDKDQMAAMLNLYCNNKETLEAYICDVYVCDEYRRKGLAKQMMLRAIEICRERNFKGIRLHVANDNIPAISLYKALGFVNTENTDERFNSLQEMILNLI